MDNRFWEDENELPYLVWETRDDGRRSNSNIPNREVDIRDRPFREFASVVNGLNIPDDDKANIINSIVVKPANCRFSIRRFEDRLIFEFKVENRYVTTDISAIYENHELYRGSYSNYHSRLESEDWFQSEVSRISGKIGLDYYSCASGYGCKFSNGNLLIKDDCCVLVYFGDGDTSSDYSGYKINFKSKRLIEYHVFSGHELFGPFYV